MKTPWNQLHGCRPHTTLHWSIITPYSNIRTKIVYIIPTPTYDIPHAFNTNMARMHACNLNIPLRALEATMTRLTNSSLYYKLTLRATNERGEPTAS